MSVNMYDVVIIGGGPAGLSAALGLARQLYSVVVLDSGHYRNYAADRMHNVLTWDHKIPADYRATAKANILSRYKTVQFRSAKIKSLRKVDESKFEAVDESENKYIGKRLLLATGVTDIFPDIKGYESCWGKSIFHCLFCHGFEERGGNSAGVLAVGVLSNPLMALHMARMANRLAEQITIYTHGNSAATKEIQEALGSKPVSIESRKISSFERKDSEEATVTIQFEDGSSKEEAFVVHLPQTAINGPIADLDLEVDHGGFLKTNPPFYETNVSGVFAVGDCATPMRAVSQAVAMGAFSAGGLVAQLGAMGRL